MNKKPKVKGLFLLGFLSVAVVLISVFALVSSFIVDRSDRNIFGYSAFTVASDNLSTEGFSLGDIVITEKASPSVLKENDTIVFVSQNENSFGETMARNIRSISEEGIITYNSVTGEDDGALVSPEEVIGKLIFSVPKAGIFFGFLKTVPGYILCVFIPLIILISARGINSIILFRKYRDEELAEIENLKRQENENIFIPKEIPEKPFVFEEETDSADTEEGTPVFEEVLPEPEEINIMPDISEEADAPDPWKNLNKEQTSENEAEPSINEMLEKLRKLRENLDFDN